MYNSIVHSKNTTPAIRLLIFLPHLFCRSHCSTTAAAAAAAAPSSATLSFLINSCGLSPESALSASQTIQLKSIERSASVLQLFRDYGLTGSQIATIIAKQPSLLRCRAEENLKPKMEFLHSVGFSGAALGRLLTASPLVLHRSLDKHLVPCFGFYKTILVTNKNVVATFLTSPRALHANVRENILPCIQLLRQHGLPETRVSKLVVLHPGVLLDGLARVKELVEALSRIGLRPTDDAMFIHAYGTISGMRRSTWEKKMDLYRSFGLSDDEILSGFRKLPACMKMSEKKISLAMEFYVNSLKLAPTHIFANSKLLLPSLEKTIKPRCAILSILMTKGKIKKNISLISTLILSKKYFLQRFVQKYQDDVPEVLKAYRGEMEFNGLKME